MMSVEIRSGKERKNWPRIVASLAGLGLVATGCSEQSLENRDTLSQHQIQTVNDRAEEFAITEYTNASHTTPELAVSDSQSGIVTQRMRWDESYADVQITKFFQVKVYTESSEGLGRLVLQTERLAEGSLEGVSLYYEFDPSDLDLSSEFTAGELSNILDAEDTELKKVTELDAPGHYDYQILDGSLIKDYGDGMQITDTKSNLRDLKRVLNTKD